MYRLITIIALLFPLQLLAEDKVIHIYQDADISNHLESSDAIQKGIEVAFDEIGSEIDGYKIVYKYLDHRGNVVRSKRNYKTFIDDPKALVMFSGIHSPPLIKHRSFINEQKALTLVPWAAGGPITRHPSKENWVFRLSIDDTQAALTIIDYALNEQGCESPHLLLEDTPWGDSNLKSMTKVLSKNNLNDTRASRFSWNLGKLGARAILRNITQAGDDCIILVGNAVEGALIVKQMVELPSENRLPIVSHWGITSGNFHEEVTASDRGKLDLSFIQTCFAFTNSKQSELAQRVFSSLREHTNGTIDQASDLKSAVGFIHAYDLTKLLIQAINQTGLTGRIDEDREAIRLALENIDKPIEGLVKTYNKPFTVFDESTNYNAHEALNAENYCMAKYGKSDEVVIYSSPNK